MARLRIDAAALVVEYDEAVDMPTPFTAKQGQYLAFIYFYSKIHGMPPAEADFRRFLRVTPPVVHPMIKALHARIHRPRLTATGGCPLEAGTRRRWVP
jgi:hypothetical protein